MMELSKRELSSRVKLIAIQTDKFKTSMLGLTFLEPLSQKTASETRFCLPCFVEAHKSIRICWPCPPLWTTYTAAS